MILVADIGGSHMRIAVSDAHDSFEEPVIHDTPAEFDAAVALFASTAQEIAHDRVITGAVIGIAGLLSRDRRTLLRAPNLREWEGRNVAETFSKALGAPVRFENDVALGALGEAISGAGKGASIVAYIANGTGINGARVVDGRLDRSALGFEIGWQLLGIDADAPEWGSLVSGAGLAEKYGKPASEIADPAIWNECADHFAYGLYNTILHWSPERIVLGGSLFLGQNPIPLDRLVSTLRSINDALQELPDIQLAALGDHSCLYGALAFAEAPKKAIL